MGYVGNEPSVNFTSFAKQDLTGVTGSPAKRGFTLTYAVANANEIEVFVNNVRQEPTEAYTVSGTALTMTGDVETTDDFYIIYLGKAIQTTVPPDGSVTNSKIANSTIDLTSKVTGVLPVANSQTNTPTFYVTKTGSDQSMAQATETVVTFNNEVIDSDNKFTNNTFTPTVSGNYYLFARGQVTGTIGDNSTVYIAIRKNGSGFALHEMKVWEAGSYSLSVSVNTIVSSDTDDYFDVVMYNSSGSPPIRQGSSFTHFGGYKLIGA